MHSASSLFLLQKVTSGNILGIGRKFTGIFYRTNEDRCPKDSFRGPTQGRATPAMAPLDPRVRPAPALWDKFWGSPEDFPKYDIELRRHRRQVLGVRLFLFQHPVGTGIDPGAISFDYAASMMLRE